MSLQTTTLLSTIRQDFITIKPPNFTDSLSSGCSGIALDGHVLADQPPQHEIQLGLKTSPAHQVNPSAICWEPEPISACAAQTSSKRATNPEHLEGISFTAHARRDCAACARLVPCLPGALVLLSTCLRAELCWHGARVRDFQMSGSSVPQGSDKTCNIFRFYGGQRFWVKRWPGLCHNT